MGSIIMSEKDASVNTMYNITLHNVTIEDSFSLLTSGPIYSKNIDVFISDSNFKNNTSSENGGALTLICSHSNS